MKEEIEISVYRNATNMKTTIAASIQDHLGAEMCSAILRLVAEKIADKYVEEHYAELAAKLDQQAIANLAIADSGKKIAKEIRTRPVVIREPGPTTNVRNFSIF